MIIEDCSKLNSYSLELYSRLPAIPLFALQSSSPQHFEIAFASPCYSLDTLSFGRQPIASLSIVRTSCDNGFQLKCPLLISFPLDECASKVRVLAALTARIMARSRLVIVLLSIIVILFLSSLLELAIARPTDYQPVGDASHKLFYGIAGTRNILQAPVYCPSNYRVDKNGRCRLIT